MGLSDFSAEREELGWYFAGVGPTLGLRAAGLEGGGGRTYDEAASLRDHMRHFEPAHRQQVRRLAAVREALGRTPAGLRGTLESAFQPFGAARASYRLLTTVAAEGVCLVGVAVHHGAALQAWEVTVGERAGETCERPSTLALVLWLEDQVSGLRFGNRIPSGHRLQRVVETAAEQACAALVAYRGNRRDVARDQRQERAEEHAAYMARIRATMAGIS